MGRKLDGDAIAAVGVENIGVEFDILGVGEILGGDTSSNESEGSVVDTLDGELVSDDSCSVIQQRCLTLSCQESVKYPPRGGLH